MVLLNALLRPFQLWNDLVLPIGRWISIVAIALMVVAILIQVFFRYVLNNALPWPDEAARFMMLWLTGLMAPIAFRQGGFVAIDMVVQALPMRLGQIVSILLLIISAGVLALAVNIGWGEVTGFGGKFKSASLYVPISFDLSEWLRVPRSWMMTSLLVGVVLLFIVNIELILRSLITLLGGGDRLRELAPADDEVLAE